MLGLAITCVVIGVAGVWRSAPNNPLGILVFFPALIAQQFTLYVLLGCALLLLWSFLNINIHDNAVPVMVLAAIAAQCCWVCYRRALATGPTLQAALEGTAQPATPRLPTRDASASGLLPFAVSRAQKQGLVRCQKNIRFTPHGERGLLDVYHPAETTAGQSLPVLLHIHGGAWISGNKANQGLPLMHFLAQRGWVCVSAHYRLSPADRFPAHLEDVLAAIDWIGQTGPQYGADPTRLAVTGGSAGGHLVSLAALLQDHPQREALTNTVPILGHDLPRIGAAVPVYARFDFLDRAGVTGLAGVKPMAQRQIMPPGTSDDDPLWDLASPVAWVHEQAPPFFMIHGSHDSLVPIEEAAYFREQLQTVSHAPVIFGEVSGAQHAFDLCHTPWTSGMAPAVETFLTNTFSAQA